MTFDYDIVIIGSGYGGSITALVARALKQRTLLVEASDHPRFAIGESTTPEQNLRLEYLGRRYDIPLLSQVSSYPKILRSGVPVATWPKCSFYFVHHEPGQPVDPNDPQEIVMQTSPWPTGPDCHIYRPDLDLLLKDEAVAYGADYLPYTTCEGFESSPDAGAFGDASFEGRKRADRKRAAGRGRNGTTVVSGAANGPASGGLARRADVLRVGFRALQKSLALGADIESAKGPSVFARPCDGASLFPRRLVLGHSFDNGLTSVGWVSSTPLDESVSPEENFFDAVARMPSFARQFENAEATTPFYRMPRLQWSTKKACGDAWMMLPHAAEFIDPWLSAGMALTTTAIVRLGEVIRTAAPDRSIGADVLAPVEEKFRVEAKYVRKIVDGCKRSLHDPRLFAPRDGAAPPFRDLERPRAVAHGLHLRRRGGDGGGGATATQTLIDRVYGFILALDPEQRTDDKTLAELDGIIREFDSFRFLASRMGRIRENGLYLVSATRMVDLLVRSDMMVRSSGLASVHRVANRWLRNFKPVQRRGPVRPFPPGLVRRQIFNFFPRVTFRCPSKR
ncbi:MAG: tryptophan 7-halogenase [Deltaproteobacteria bacterium]|nr:tryptophan 7-halogenase [Deltaproteobacteria bacterium]